MARDILNVAIQVDRIHCHDEGDGWGSAEPYLWTVFFKVDGTTHSIEGLGLQGTALVAGTPGSHGNLGTTDVDEGDDITVPDVIGAWQTILTPIPVPADLQGIVGSEDLPGTVGAVCVLMEEDNVTDDGAEAGHQALNQAVQDAVAGLVASLGPNHTQLTEDEIKAATDGLGDRIGDAIANQQGFFENAWSWLNADDEIGHQVFTFNHDSLVSNPNQDFNERWRKEGDWELFGHVTASVLCAADVVRSGAGIVDAIFGDHARSMREFRNKEFPHRPGLSDWWSLAQRNLPQLTRAMLTDDAVKSSAGALLLSVRDVLSKPDRKLPEEFFCHAERVLSRLAMLGPRQTRKDATRSLELLRRTRGQTVAEVLDLLSMVRPARHPRLMGNLRVRVDLPSRVSVPGWRKMDERGPRKDIRAPNA